MASQKKNLRILKDILKTEIKMEDAQENVKILGTALDVLIDQMKLVNSLFKLMYNRMFYTGSYYDGLRVKNATEFDLNLIIMPPFRRSDFEVLTNCSPPSFAKYHLTVQLEELTKRPDWQNVKAIMDKFFDSDNYFIPDKIRGWLQGIVDSAVRMLPTINGVSEIKRTVSGPAITLYITTNSGVQLDVDLVPVLEFKWPNWPTGAEQHFRGVRGLEEESRFWFLVPKPAPELAGASEKVNHLWRLHFPEIERQLLHDKGCTKPVIKLMKLLRDKQNWKCLASYYLKTVVMWSVIHDKLDWNESHMDSLFIAMLKKLAEYIKDRNLPYLFYPSFNLLYKLESNAIHADDVYRSLIRIIRDIENDPEMYNKLLKK